MHDAYSIAALNCVCPCHESSISGSPTYRVMPSNWIYAIVTRYSILLPNKRLPFHTLLFKCRHLYYDNDFFKVGLLLIHICTSSQITWYALTISVLCSSKWIHNTSSPLRSGSDHKIIRFIFAKKKLLFRFVFSLFSFQINIFEQYYSNFSLRKCIQVEQSRDQRIGNKSLQFDSHSEIQTLKDCHLQGRAPWSSWFSFSPILRTFQESGLIWATFEQLC